MQAFQTYCKRVNGLDSDAKCWRVEEVFPPRSDILTMGSFFPPRLWSFNLSAWALFTHIRLQKGRSNALRSDTRSSLNETADINWSASRFPLDTAGCLARAKLPSVDLQSNGGHSKSKRHEIVKEEAGKIHLEVPDMDSAHRTYVMLHLDSLNPRGQTQQHTRGLNVSNGFVERLRLKT